MFEITMTRPGSPEELWAALEEHAGEYALLAGGTDLVVQTRDGHPRGKVWVDVTGLEEMRSVERRGDTLWIGATARWEELFRHPLVAEHMPAMVTCCFEMGSPQVRNLGTLGGNVANASPAGDSIPVLLAYDAVVVLRSRSGERRIPLEGFITGVRKTELAAGEVIWGFELPVPEPHQARFLKLGPRASLSISKVNAAVRARLADGKLTDVRIAVGSAAPTVYRAKAAEALLEGQPASEELVAKAAAAARDQASTISDHRSTAEYRTAMVEVLVRRGLTEVARG